MEKLRLKAYFDEYTDQKGYINKYNKYLFMNTLIARGATTDNYLQYNDTNNRDDNMLRIAPDVDNQTNFFNSVLQDGRNPEISRLTNDTSQYYNPFDAWQVRGTNMIVGQYIDDVAGHSVALSKDTNRLAVGAYKSDTIDRSKEDAGHVALYDHNDISSEWYQVGNDIYGLEAGDHSGNALSISDDGIRVAIGSYLSDGDGINGTKIDCGSVMVYDYYSVANDWFLVGNIIYGEEGDEAGTSVSLSGDGTTIAMGSPNFNNSSGRTMIYSMNDQTHTWQQKGQAINYQIENSKSGSSVSLNKDGSRVAVGTPCGGKIICYTNGTYSSTYEIRPGEVRVYEYADVNDTWIQMGNDLETDISLNFYGGSVSLNSLGDIVAIGGHGNNTNGAQSGHTRIFKYDETNNEWNQMGNDIRGEAEGDQSGWVVSLNALGDTVAISAPLNHDTDYGHARVFKYDELNNQWFKIGRDVNGKYTNQMMGYSACINGVGDKIALGSPYLSMEYGDAQVYDRISLI
jgi:hypothetical protein